MKLAKSAFLVGVGAGVAYGIACRLLMKKTELFPVTIGFLFAVPLVMGYLTIRPYPGRVSWPKRIFLPWLPWVLTVAVAYAVGLDGAICLVLAAPAGLIMASAGGIIAALRIGQSRKGMLAIMVFPLVGIP